MLGRYVSPMNTRVPGNLSVLNCIGSGAHLCHDRVDFRQIVGARVVQGNVAVVVHVRLSILVLEYIVIVAVWDLQRAW